MRNDTDGRLALRGVLGTVALVLTVLAALNINRLPLIGNSSVIHVQFAEAAGLKKRDPVMISGAQVGKVRDVRIDGPLVVADVVITDGHIEIGDRTEARIITRTLLGQAAVELEPSGKGDLEPGDTIPVARTSSPYNLTSTLNQLTETSAAIDKEKLAAALKETSSMLDSSSPDLGQALEGITALSSAVSANDDQLRSLVDRADRVTAVLGGRGEQIASLLGAGRSLLSEVEDRQDVIVGLVHSARQLSAELRLLIHDTDNVIGPALQELDRLVKVLNANRKNLQATISGLRGYTTAVGEALASGPWFDIYMQNLTSPVTMAPILSGVTQ
jgi:phospholipid/cholesterol/gamma-HCH transport system substrate-binding protein